MSDLRIAAAICVAYGDLISAKVRPEWPAVVGRTLGVLERVGEPVLPGEVKLRAILVKLMNAGIYTLGDVGSTIRQTKTGAVLVNRITRDTQTSLGAKFAALEIRLAPKLQPNLQRERSFAARMRARRKRGK